MSDVQDAGFQGKGLDRALAGHPGGSDPFLDELAALASNIRATYVTRVPLGTQERHLTAITQAARVRATGSTGTVPTGRTARPASTRPRPAYGMAALAASLALTGGMIGLAYTGSLPDPIQSELANFGDDLGLPIPHPNVDDGDVNDATEPAPDAGSTDDESSQDESSQDESSQDEGSEEGGQDEPEDSDN